MSKSTRTKITFAKKPPAKVRWGYHNSPIGGLMIGLDADNAVCRVIFAQGKKPDALLKEWKREWPQTSFAKAEKDTARIAKNILGAPAKVVMNGTEFQRKVWQALASIPKGKTLSYAEVAKRIGRPKAVRAVGTACGANPVALIVPCHRVIASNGGLGGFGGGLTMKRALLESEGALETRKRA
ncbi:MAG: methylated-DNA--[protein]-cysteine S-methyltransferase [Alphaproteobacteria bacterium]|nr:methylated-DNA--[protein]-cysteine S-methyltransferase [Alphaproteobacteria bacterium]